MRPFPRWSCGWGRLAAPTPCSPAPGPERPWSQPAALATSCGSAIRTARGCSIWRSASPSPLFSAVVEIDERIAADGTVLKAPDPEAVRAQLAALRGQAIESLAVCLLHAYVHPEHEQLIGRIARELGFSEISLSSRVAPLVKIVSRGDTTVVDAYLNPVLRAYIDAAAQGPGPRAVADSHLGRRASGRRLASSEKTASSLVRPAA